MKEESADKRPVHTDALQTLGQTITSGGRDAIHLAVEPVIAGETLNPVAFYRDSKGVLRVFIEEPIRTEIKTNKDENNNSSNADSC